MKVIDLLNKIANGEEVPEKIRFICNEFEYDKNNSKYRNIVKGKDDLLEYINFYKGIVLNDEVEIIEDTMEERYRELEKVINYKPKPSFLKPEEDKKIEKFYFSVYQDQKLGGREVIEPLETKINEIIDKINGDSNERDN